MCEAFGVGAFVLGVEAQVSKGLFFPRTTTASFSITLTLSIRGRFFPPSGHHLPCLVLFLSVVQACLVALVWWDLCMRGGLRPLPLPQQHLPGLS